MPEPASGGGGVCSQGVSAPGGVCSRGVSVPGGICSRGRLSALGGVCSQGGVCSGGGGGIPACTEADNPPCGLNHRRL